MTDKLKNTFNFKRNIVETVCIEKLIASVKTDVSGKWVSKDELKEYTDRVVSMCIVAAVNTAPHSVTTYDYSIAQGIIQKVIDNIKKSFGRT